MSNLKKQPRRFVGIKLTPKELETVQQMAQRLGETPSGVFHALLELISVEELAQRKAQAILDPKAVAATLATA